ncbi:MAG TPA: phage tail tape measure C-terminal domain-containing protein [Rhizomicrobium sp.]|nr:phage tail tape measure C-terminal domain-containing protein [Rhizomicrobium sp.]
MSTGTFSLSADLSPLDSSLAAAAKSLDDFAAGPVAQAGASIERAVNSSFEAVARTIAGAAVSGKTSMDQLVDAILADFDRVAIRDFIVKPVGGLIAQAAGSLASSIGGALAAGGPVAPGESYLVGEAGPELFTPAGNGTIVPNAALASAAARPQVVVNIQTPDAASFFRSQSQVAALMTRAVAKGQKNL